MVNSFLKIIFMGTPDFAVPALQALIDSEHQVVAVYTQPPRPKGRGHKVVPSPVDRLASTHQIPVYTPKSLKSAESQEEFAAFKADVAVVAAYGLILPKAVLEAPKYGCLNIHASLLPRWRGAAPIQYAIWQGDHESGVTIMQMEEGLDTGPMIAKTVIPIDATTTSNILHNTLSGAGAGLLLSVLEELAAKGSVESEQQDDEASSYASMLKKEDGCIDWNQTAEEIDRQVRALNPWPGTFAEFDGKRVKILEAHVTAVPYPDYVGKLCAEAETAGTFLDKTGMMLCGGRTVLQITKLQPEDKKPMDFVSAVNGGYVTI